MELFAVIFSIAVALTIGVMGLGPNCIMVARTALTVSRQDSFAAAIGMGAGSTSY